MTSSLIEQFRQIHLQNHISFGALEQCGQVPLLMPTSIIVFKVVRVRVPLHYPLSCKPFWVKNGSVETKMNDKWQCTFSGPYWESVTSHYLVSLHSQTTTNPTTILAPVQ